MNATVTMGRIEQIDLDAIKVKLMHKESGEGWSAARAETIAVEYRRFLYMLHTYPDEQFAPLVDVDTFWHYHILDTRKYAADCQQTFGYFLHHNPNVALGDSTEDAAEHAAFGARMHALYEATFGEPCLSGASAWCSIAATAWCSLSNGKTAAPRTAWCSLANDKAPAAATATAWYSLRSGKPRQAGAATAWCSLNAGKSGGSATDTAWCSLANGALASRRTAWCSLNNAAPRQRPAATLQA